MKYRDLRDFIDQLEQRGELKRIRVPVDPYLEVTEICDRTLRAGGPALLFERPKGSEIPLLGNLFGTPQRVALGMGEDSVEALREVGRLLAFLKEPDPPRGMKQAWETLPIFKPAVIVEEPQVIEAFRGWIIAYGTSWHFGLEFNDDGPRALGLISYSQSADADSPFFNDQMQRYSEKNMRPILFTESDIAANLLPGGVVTIRNN